MGGWIRVAAIIAIALPNAGCVMAARHLAREANRSSIEGKGRHRFPIGSSAAAARDALAADGYRCIDMAATEKLAARTSCWPGHRTNFAESFLIGGNWRWDLYQADGRLTRLHISSPRHGLRRARSRPPVAPAPAPSPARASEPAV